HVRCRAVNSAEGRICRVSMIVKPGGSKARRLNPPISFWYCSGVSADSHCNWRCSLKPRHSSQSGRLERQRCPAIRIKGETNRRLPGARALESFERHHESYFVGDPNAIAHNTVAISTSAIVPLAGLPTALYKE